MDHQRHPRPARSTEPASTVVALVAVLTIALAGVLTLVLGPTTPAAASPEPPQLAAPTSMPPATLRPMPPPATAPETTRPGPGSWPTQSRPTQPRPSGTEVGHSRLVTGPSRPTVRTATLATSHQMITDGRANQLVDAVGPALVNVTARLRDGSTVAGTGIVLRSDGLVLTNDHVIAGAVALQGLSLATQRSYRATVLAAGEVHDVAVIGLRGARHLPVGRFGDSDRLRVGDQVASLGNAWGVGGRPSVNVGPITRLTARIASTTHPPTTTGDTDQLACDIDPCDEVHDGEVHDGAEPGAPLTGLIEARNRIQPGESGGPMVDHDGRIVGLNVAYSGHNGHPTGYGYAIPINQALNLAASMLNQA